MQIETLLRGLRDCPCGRVHTCGVHAVGIGENVTARAGRILAENGFPKRILLTTQTCTLHAAAGLPEALARSAFSVRVQLFDDLTAAEPASVRRMQALCREADGILAVGSGTLCDVCRRAAYLEDKAFAVFATAPSMDGFASDTAPVLQHGFKISLPARQPSVILADTDVLTAAPAHLKSAGFGDMLAKYIAVADWRIAHCLTGEYYCENVASLVRAAVARVAAMADHIPDNDAQTAQNLMESLVMTGLAMQFCGSSRAAGGAEHVVSHFWETMQLMRGERTDCHGRKVGAATGMIARLYHTLLRDAQPERFRTDATDWARVFAVYGTPFHEDIRRLNFPPVTQDISPAWLRARWEDVCRIVREEIPQPQTIDDLLRRACAARTLTDVGIGETLGLQGLEYHPYMRRRVLLSRLIPMLDVAPDYRAAALMQEDDALFSPYADPR